MIVRVVAEAAANDSNDHAGSIARPNIAWGVLLYFHSVAYSVAARNGFNVEGYKINDYQTLERVRIDRAQIADTLIYAYVQQVLIDARIPRIPKTAFSSLITKVSKNLLVAFN